MNSAGQGMTRPQGRGRRLHAYPFVTEVVTVPSLLILAAWLFWGSNLLDADLKELIRKSSEEISAIDPERLSPRMRPEPLGDPPLVHIGGFDRTCNDCHRIRKPPEQIPRRLTQHANFVLDHGMNDRCYNCHDREDRNLLVLNGGVTIPFTQVVELCAKCHGPTYRDWEQGMHGRTDRYWAIELGEPIRRGCTECHAPHAPAFAPMDLLPGPNTHRMGSFAHSGPETGLDGAGEPMRRPENPLLRWSFEATPAQEPVRFYDLEDEEDYYYDKDEGATPSKEDQE